jgi:hypothetical protein
VYYAPVTAFFRSSSTAVTHLHQGTRAAVRGSVPMGCASSSSTKDIAVDPPPQQQRFSFQSQTTLDTLEGLDTDLAQMESVSAAAGKTLASQGMDLPSALRTELAKLHGDANRLLANRVDAVSTADLKSGCEEARAKRRSMVVRAEALIGRIEEQIKAVDQAKEASRTQSTSPSSSRASSAAASPHTHSPKARGSSSSLREMSMDPAAIRASLAPRESLEARCSSTSTSSGGSFPEERL